MATTAIGQPPASRGRCPTDLLQRLVRKASHTCVLVFQGGAQRLHGLRIADLPQGLGGSLARSAILVLKGGDERLYRPRVTEFPSAPAAAQALETGQVVEIPPCPELPPEAGG